MSEIPGALSHLSLPDLVRMRDALRVHCNDQLTAAQRDGRTYMTPTEASAISRLEALCARIDAVANGGRDV